MSVRVTRMVVTNLGAERRVVVELGAERIEMVVCDGPLGFTVDVWRLGSPRAYHDGEKIVDWSHDPTG